MLLPRLSQDRFFAVFKTREHLASIFLNAQNRTDHSLFSLCFTQSAKFCGLSEQNTLQSLQVQHYTVSCESCSHIRSMMSGSQLMVTTPSTSPPENGRKYQCQSQLSKPCCSFAKFHPNTFMPSMRPQLLQLLLLTPKRVNYHTTSDLKSWRPNFCNALFRVGAYRNCPSPHLKYTSIIGNISLSVSVPNSVDLTTWAPQRRFFAVKRKDHKFPELRPEDLEEEFVRGSGPGGQSVNKTSNCVVLKHIPTGTVVKCHETRSLDENRKRARLRLEEKLDLDLNGDQSFLAQVKTEGEEAKREKKRRNSRRLALKAAFKERQKLD